MRPMLGQHRLQKHSGGCLVRSAEIPSPRHALIDEINDCVMNYERSALVRVLRPTPGSPFSHHGGDMWRALARRFVKYNWPLMRTKQMTRFLDPSRMAKNRCFSGVGEDCRTPPAKALAP